MTKAQIKNQINQLNRSLNSYKTQKTQYETLKTKITQIINLLSSNINNLDNSKSYLKSGYGGDVNTTPYKNTNNDIQKVTEIKKYLESEVILEINNQIIKLNNNCTDTQNKISELWKEYYRAEN